MVDGEERRTGFVFWMTTTASGELAIVVKYMWMTTKLTCCAVTNHYPEIFFDYIMVLIVMSVALQGEHSSLLLTCTRRK